VHEVVDGGALLEELRVGDDDEGLLGVLGHHPGDALGGADRDGALVDDDGGRVEAGRRRRGL
jgi:hypothetical protein